jgi:1-acyl-sn-glycerol-3-phosphate acyltransferase
VSAPAQTSSGLPRDTSDQPPLKIFVHKTLVYRLCRGGVWLYLKLRNRMRVEGREQVPAEGGALIVANHQSVLDIPLMAASTSRHISFVARKSLAKSWLLGFIMRQCGAVLIDRGAGDRTAMREMVEHLTRGDLVAIFPEGTRTQDGSVGEFKRGALLAARKAKVPLLPASINGSFGIWPRTQKFPGRGRISVRYSPLLPADGENALSGVRSAVVAGVCPTSGPSR